MQVGCGARHPVRVHIDPLFEDVVLFELPSYHSADRLSRSLRSSWLAWMEPGDGVWLVGAALRPAADDLAVLLRSVAEWATECSFRAVAFRLDGRVYVVEPAGVGVGAAA
jgi:hypothetical protein